MPDYNVLDLLQATNDGKPQDFKTAFDDVISAKISDAIDAKKVEVRDQMFNAADDNGVEEDDVEDFSDDVEEYTGDDVADED